MKRMGNVQIKFHFIKTVLKSEQILRIFENVFFGYFIISTWPSLANRIHIRTPVIWILWLLCRVYHLCVGCSCQYIWILSMGEEKVEIHEWNQMAMLTSSLVTKINIKLNLIGKFVIFHRRYAVTSKWATEQVRDFAYASWIFST